jgi:hypothetical protein
MGMVVLFSSFANGWLKNLLRVPRPFARDPAVGLAHEESFSLPSGHSQGSATFWTVASPLFKAPWGLVLAIALPLAIGFTRVYLGVHYPTDVVSGWLLGYAIAIPALLLGDTIEAALRAANVRVSMLAVAVIAIAMNFLDPSQSNSSGAFFGMGIGLAFARVKAPFSAKGNALEKALRFLVGIAGVAILYFGLKAIEGPLVGMASDFGILENLLRFVRYAAIGVWASFGAPLCFIAMSLARAHESEAIPEAVDNPVEDLGDDAP